MEGYWWHAGISLLLISYSRVWSSSPISLYIIVCPIKNTTKEWLANFYKTLGVQISIKEHFTMTRASESQVAVYVGFSLNWKLLFFKSLNEYRNIQQRRIMHYFEDCMEVPDHIIFMHATFIHKIEGFTSIYIHQNNRISRYRIFFFSTNS